MKKRRLVGVMFIVSSLLLPIGYAASFNMPVVIASGERYEVGFETIDFDISGEEQYIEVQKGTSDRNSVNFSVANIYPGANFRMEPVIKNYGTDAIKINAITVQYTGGDETFFSFLRGNDDQGQSLGVDEYNRYLVEKVKGRELKANESLRLELSMGLAPVITDLKNVDVGLRLTISFEQAVADPISTPTPTEGVSEEPVPGGATTEVVPEEPVPGGVITEVIPEEPVPGGVITEVVPEEPAPTGEVKEVGRSKGTLPKTGGIGTGVIYIIATGLFGTGIILYRKKEKK